MSSNRILKPQEKELILNLHKHDDIKHYYKEYFADGRSLSKYHRYFKDLLSTYNTLKVQLEQRFHLPDSVLREFHDQHAKIAKAIEFIEKYAGLYLKPYEPSNLVTRYNKLLEESHFGSDRLFAHLMQRLLTDITINKNIFGIVLHFCKGRSLFETTNENDLPYQETDSSTSSTAVNYLCDWHENHPLENKDRYPLFITEAKLWQEKIFANLNKSSFVCNATNSTSIFTFFALTVGAVGTYAISQYVSQYAAPR